MEFTKNLSPSEAKYKYLGLPKKDREQFPEKEQIFEMEFKGKSYLFILLKASNCFSF